MTFKKGDRVQAIKLIDGKDFAGKKGTVIKDPTTATSMVMVEFDEYISGHSDEGAKAGHGRWANPCELIKISSTSNMNLIEKAKLAFKGEPEKSFIKAGVMDGNENLTKEGQELFLTYLLKQNGEAFKKDVIDPILAEDEKKLVAEA